MAITSFTTGSATFSTTETSLITGTAAPQASTSVGIFQLVLDLVNLTTADTYEIRIYEKAISAGTQRLCFSKRITGVVSEPVYIVPSIVLMYGWDMTVKKISGTDRAIPWSIRQVS